MQAAMLVLLLRRHCVIWGEYSERVATFFTNDKLRLHRDIKFGGELLT